MRVEVKLFAVARQLAGRDALLLEMPSSATVADVRTAVCRQIPGLGDLAEHLNFAVDHRYANDETPIRADSEIACVPPVSGG